MEYGINIKYLARQSPLSKVAEIVARAGIKNLDCSLDFNNDNWEQALYHDLALYEKNGLSVHQTHAPFNRYGLHGDKHKEYIWRTLKATKAFGAKYMVVHGDEFDFDNMQYTPQNALEYNYEFFAPYVEEAEKLGLKIAFETVFEDGFNNTHRFCANSDDLLALIRKFNTDTVCCCWDFGHAGVSFKEKHSEKILEFGDLIQCTHVHDCGHDLDLHLVPFHGENNWNSCMGAMRKIGYSGSLTFEMVYGSIPDNMLESFVDYLVKTADSLASIK